MVAFFSGQRSSLSVILKLIMSDSRAANQQTESLTGVVERITFSAENDGYTIARLQVQLSKDLVTIVGNFANLQLWVGKLKGSKLLTSHGSWLSVKRDCCWGGGLFLSDC